MQVHGGAGVSGDTFLARAWAGLRTLRIADGPDIVHQRTVALLELKDQTGGGSQASPTSASSRKAKL
jgi:acyl-CoA dehydrogenase